MTDENKALTVGELIEQLKEMPSEMEVWSCCDDLGEYNPYLARLPVSRKIQCLAYQHVNNVHGHMWRDEIWADKPDSDVRERKTVLVL